MEHWTLAGKILFFVLLIIDSSFFIGTPLILYSVGLCKRNNVFGILLFTLLLNIIGTIIGCLIIYKKNNPDKLKFDKLKLKFTKFKNLFKRKKKIILNKQENTN